MAKHSKLVLHSFRITHYMWIYVGTGGWPAGFYTAATGQDGKCGA